MAKDDDKAPSRLKIVAILVYAIVGLLITFLLTGIEGNSADVKRLEENQTRIERFLTDRIDNVEEELRQDIAQIEDQFDAEITRLDESNRNHRNQIASLEVAAADNSVKIDELRRDIERLLPQDVNTP